MPIKAERYEGECWCCDDPYNIWLHFCPAGPKPQPKEGEKDGTRASNRHLG